MKTIATDTDATIALAYDLETRCPFDDLTDEYRVIVEYVPRDRAIEFGAWRDTVEEYRGREIAHETLCDRLFECFIDAVSPREVTLTVAGDHYGVDVEVTRTG